MRQPTLLRYLGSTYPMTQTANQDHRPTLLPSMLIVLNGDFCYSLAMKDSDKRLASVLAKAITALCVRNTFLEDLHAGTSPSSKTGDYSDVKLVTPYGEIPWRNVSRISDEEMKRLMKQVVNSVYTFLCRQQDPAFLEAFIAWGSRSTDRWDEPEMQKNFVVPEKPSRKPRQRKGDAG